MNIEFVEKSILPTKEESTYRFIGVKSDGTEVYINRTDGFVAIKMVEEAKKENE